MYVYAQICVSDSVFYDILRVATSQNSVYRRRVRIALLRSHKSRNCNFFGYRPTLLLLKKLAAPYRYKISDTSSISITSCNLEMIKKFGEISQRLRLYCRFQIYVQEETSQSPSVANNLSLYALINGPISPLLFKLPMGM